MISIQAYEDSVEIQKKFITTRDNICRNGEGAGFSSPAISYTPRTLSKSVEELTAQKLVNEKPEPTDDGSKRKVGVKTVVLLIYKLCDVISSVLLYETVSILLFQVPDKFESLPEMEKDGTTYKVGDFVHVISRYYLDQHSQYISADMVVCFCIYLQFSSSLQHITFPIVAIRN